MLLDGKRTAPARIRLLKGPRGGKGESNSWWVVELQEGRNRQIREMFFRIGNPVQRLIRVGIGRVSDRELPVGSYRELSAQEVESLRTGKPPRRPKRKRRRPDAPRGQSDDGQAHGRGDRRHLGGGQEHGRQATGEGAGCALSRDRSDVPRARPQGRSSWVSILRTGGS